MRHPKILLPVVLAAAAAAIVMSSAAAPERAQLVARAILPANTFAPGPPSGQFIGAGPINGVTVPFAGQPVQGFSAVLPAEEGSFWVMPDNGYGAKANSADFLLRLYHVTPHFRTARGGDGTVTVGNFIQFRDPDGKIPFPITRADRLLTGADFDIESIRKVRDGSFWIGDEFGPFLVHTDATGKLLDAPVQTPGVQASENPFRVGPANLPSSGGFEGMALAGHGRTLFPMLEKAVTGDDPQVRRIYSFDTRTQSFDDRRRLYRLDPGSVSIGDFTQLGDDRFVVIERDNGQGPAAQIKRIYEVDLHHVNPDGTLVKTPAVDLMKIADPAGISLPGRPGDLGLGTTFSFPYVTIEDVLPLDDNHLLVINDNNFPFSTGRNPSLPDDNDFIVVRTDALDD